MASLVEATLEAAFDNNLTMNDIFELENQINKFHMEIDDNVFKYLALNNPHARDLRTALSVMKINSELERIADQAVSTKRIFSKLTNEHTLLIKLNDEAKMSVRASIDSFVTGDTSMATDIIKNDLVINELNSEIFRIYIEEIKSNHLNFEEGLGVIRVAKNLERVGDHATNIAEDVIFLEKGTDIRHNHDLKFANKKARNENKND